MIKGESGIGGSGGRERGRERGVGGECGEWVVLRK